MQKITKSGLLKRTMLSGDRSLATLIKGGLKIKGRLRMEEGEWFLPENRRVFLEDRRHYECLEKGDVIIFKVHGKYGLIDRHYSVGYTSNI